MALKWTKKALENLAEIVAHIGRDNPDRGDSFAQEIQAKIKNLADFPGMGRPGRVIGTRELVVHENYIIPYRVNGGVLVILSVRHAAKRWPGRF